MEFPEFPATGIYPSDPERVLRKIPTTANSSSDNSSVLSDAVLDLLKSYRHGNATGSRSRGKKATVAPGKSMTHREREEPEEESDEDDQQDGTQPSTSGQASTSGQSARKSLSDKLDEIIRDLLINQEDPDDEASTDDDESDTEY